MLDALVIPRAARPAAARLLIHVVGAHPSRRGRLPSPLRRLLGLFTARRWRTELQATGPPLDIRIDDLQGRRLLTIQDPGPLIDVPLPPGTYHVTARLGPVQRSYTLALDPDAAFDLHLRLAAGPS